MTTEQQKIYIVYAIIGIIVFYILKKNAKAIIENVKAKKETKVVKTKTEDNTKSGMSKTQIRIATAQIYDYMNRLGTDENGLLRVSKSLNGKEMQQVFQNFGIRKYFAGARGEYLGENLNLFGWFDSELSGSTLNQMRKLWKKSGLKWT